MVELRPSAEEIIRALGLQHRPAPSSDVMPGCALFGAGILVGAGLALLFAPSSGGALGEELGQRVGELRERVTPGSGNADDDNGA